MAKRKRTTRKRTMSSAPARRMRTAVTTARRKRSRKSGLAEAFSPASAKSAGMDMVKGSLGGLATAVIEKGMTSMVTGDKAKLYVTGAVVVGSFIAHAVLKQPQIASGMMGAQAYVWSKSIPGLNDDAHFADDDVLADQPDFMDEDGTPYYLNENGDLVAMADDSMEEDYA